mgnify:CR=1 FL=1
MEKQVLNLEDISLDTLMALYGENDSNLKMVADCFKTGIFSDEGRLYVADEQQAEKVSEVLKQMISVYRHKGTLEKEDVSSILNNEARDSFYRKEIATGAGNRRFYLRSSGQKKLYEAYENHVITIATGPAGTGKTFLAVVYATNLLKKGLIKKIIITRGSDPFQTL